jgi:hypothetical protein
MITPPAERAAIKYGKKPGTDALARISYAVVVHTRPRTGPRVKRISRGGWYTRLSSRYPGKKNITTSIKLLQAVRIS